MRIFFILCLFSFNSFAEDFSAEQRVSINFFLMNAPYEVKESLSQQISQGVLGFVNQTSNIKRDYTLKERKYIADHVDLLHKLPLTHIDLTHMALTAFPEKIFTIPGLKVLACDYNCISNFPENFAEARDLEILSLNYNELSRLPYEVIAHPQLRLLDIAHNKFKKFPNMLIRHTLVHRDIYLEGNPLRFENMTPEAQDIILATDKWAARNTHPEYSTRTKKIKVWTEPIYKYTLIKGPHGRKEIKETLVKPSRQKTKKILIREQKLANPKPQTCIFLGDDEV